MSISYCMWQGLLSYHVRVTPTKVELSPLPKFSSDIKTDDGTLSCMHTKGMWKSLLLIQWAFWGSRCITSRSENGLKNRERRPAREFYGGLGLGLEYTSYTAWNFCPNQMQKKTSKLSFQFSQLWGKRWWGKGRTLKLSTVKFQKCRQIITWYHFTH